MTSPKSEFPPAPPPSDRHDARLTPDEVRGWLDKLKAELLAAHKRGTEGEV